jgi:hypothetical protein
LASALITNLPSVSVTVPFVVPLTITVAPGNGAPVSSVTLPEIGWARDITCKREFFISKKPSFLILSENAWDGLILKPVQDIKHAEAHKIFDNRKVEYINLSVGWLNFFDAFGC